MDGMSSAEAVVVTLDVGTSSVRTLLFDARGRQQDGFGEQIHYQFTATPDGGVELPADQLLDLSLRSLSTIHEQVRAAGLKPAAVGFSSFWHSLLGVDRAGKPTTPLLHLFDTRSARQVRKLEQRLDPNRVHARTGCVLHSSYWPAKLFWLCETRPDAFRATDRWISFGEYLFLKLFGVATASTSMVSATGLWNQAANNYDDEVLAALSLTALPVDKLHLCPLGEMDQAQSELLAPYRGRLAALQGIPWFPALGDGACDSVGSGCVTPDRFALMVGSSGALRAICQPAVNLPYGLWCYRVDRSRFVLGGSLSNGGDVYDWMHRTFALPDPAETEKQLEAMAPGAHGLLLLPFLAGERSPYWRSDLRAAITGLGLSTRPIDILEAALESVALRFLEIYELMAKSLGQPGTLIASGGGLLRSPAWTQMMADALGLPVTTCLEPEATSRGAALLALERLGVMKSVDEAAPRLGAVHQPRAEYRATYTDLLDRQRLLFQKLFPEN
jgi:gluconokinase